MKHLPFNFIIFCIGVVLLTACNPDPGHPEEDNELRLPTPAPPGVVTDTSIPKPSNILVAGFVGGVKISWDPVDAVDSYQVYRKQGDDAWAEVESIALNPFYLDTDLDIGKPARYRLRAVKGKRCSQFSEESPLVPSLAHYVKAGRFACTDRIEISWASHQGAQSYLIYRFPSSLGDSAVLLGEFIKGSDEYENLKFTDRQESAIDPLKKDTPYYYRVLWRGEDDILYGGNFPYTLGIYSNLVDYGEPLNNSCHNLYSEPASQFNTHQPPLLYALSDNNGGMISDVDWYKYTGTPSLVGLKVTIPSDSSLIKNGNRLMFQWHYREQDILPAKELIPGENILFFDNFESSGDVVDLYFSVFPEYAGIVNISGTYTLEYLN